MTEVTVIQRVQTNPSAYDIVLFNQRIVSNLVNFFCTDDRNFKSILSWDFAFDLCKSPVLALNYQNFTLMNKTTGKSPVKLGPVLLCYEKDEKAIKLLCDTLLDISPGLAENLKILGVDGENGILNQTCNAFTFATLLLCLRYTEENERNRHINNDCNIWKRFKKELVDSESVEEFKTEIEQFFASLSGGVKEWRYFIHYFMRSKADIIKYNSSKKQSVRAN